MIAPLTELTADKWKSVQAVTLGGVFYGVKHGARQMLEQGRPGVIINISSVNAQQPGEGQVAYCAAKAGVDMITRCGALELGGRGIRVVGIAPGLVETPLTRKELENPAMRELFMGVIPMKRAVEAEEIAEAAVFLASDNARSINGAHDRDRRRFVDARLSGTADRFESQSVMMIDPRRYTSGRIAVANLSASIESLELRRVEGATFENLVALSKLLFLRGDLLGRIADHDRAELVANEAIALSPGTASALYTRARLAERFHRFEEATRFSIKRSRPDIQDKRSISKRRRCSRRRDNIARRWFCAKDWRRTILGFTRLGRSRRCWRKWINGRRPKHAMRPRSRRTMAYRLSRAGQLLFEWGVSAMRRGDLDRAEAMFAELDAILPAHVPGRGHRAEVALARGELDVAAALIEPLLEISDDPEYRATYAEILAARGDGEAASEAERAAAGYERLLARRPEAYADHAAAFFMGVGNRPRLAVDLATANWKLRDTPRSRRLLAKALRNARASFAGSRRGAA